MFFLVFCSFTLATSYNPPPLCQWPKRCVFMRRLGLQYVIFYFFICSLFDTVNQLPPHPHMTCPPPIYHLHYVSGLNDIFWCVVWACGMLFFIYSFTHFLMQPTGFHHTPKTTRSLPTTHFHCVNSPHDVFWHVIWASTVCYFYSLFIFSLTADRLPPHSHMTSAVSTAKTTTRTQSSSIRAARNLTKCSYSKFSTRRTRSRQKGEQHQWCKANSCSLLTIKNDLRCSAHSLWDTQSW